jgi:hypothetical protein
MVLTVVDIGPDSIVLENPSHTPRYDRYGNVMLP